LFQILTHAHGGGIGAGRQEARVGVVRVPDVRLERLIEMFKPQKNVYATIEYMHMPGSVIELGAYANEKEVTLSVADRGPGFSPGDEKRVFEKFFRGNSHGARSGAGLGLAICKGVVELHGGRIWAENRAGGGAAIHFTLPLAGKPPHVALADA